MVLTLQGDLATNARQGSPVPSVHHARPPGIVINASRNTSADRACWCGGAIHAGCGDAADHGSRQRQQLLVVKADRQNCAAENLNLCSSWQYCWEQTCRDRRFHAVQKNQLPTERGEIGKIPGKVIFRSKLGRGDASCCRLSREAGAVYDRRVPATGNACKAKCKPPARCQRDETCHEDKIYRMASSHLLAFVFARIICKYRKENTPS